MPNANASLSYLRKMADEITSDTSFNVVTTFLNNPNTNSTAGTVSGTAFDNYNAAIVWLNTKLASFGTVANDKNDLPALLLALDDGTVIYDSTKPMNQTVNDTTAEKNSLYGYSKKLINENHNSRPEILNAILSSSGAAFSRRYSSSSSAVRQYYAVRLGMSPQSNIATLRVSQLETA